MNQQNVKESTSTPEVIGEGAYGCVVKPTLTCKDDPSINYENKVSKIMTKKHAERELDDFNKVLSVPGIENHFIPKPQLCTPNDDKTYQKMFQMCKNEKIKAPGADPRLLIMEDGGITLSKVLELIPSMTQKDFQLFVCQWRELINSVYFLWKHKIIHHDLKLENVVYNMKTGKLRIIDFGKVRSMATFIELSKNKENLEGVEWFNYPVENQCTNKDAFESKGVCKYIRQKVPYEEFIIKASMTFDMYGTGLIFQDIMDALKEYKKMMNMKDQFLGIPWGFFQEFETMAKRMYDQDIQTRETDPSVFLDEYETICRKYNVKCNAPIRVSKRIQKSLETMEHVVPENIFQFAQVDTESTCKKKKMKLNPYTKKCVKKCSKKKKMVRVNRPPSNTRKNGVFKCAKK